MAMASNDSKGSGSHTHRHRPVWLPLSRSIYQKPYFDNILWIIPRWVWLWLFPLFVGGFGFFVQNLQLHCATYFYVHQMKQFDLQRGPVNSSGVDPGEPIPLSIGVTPQNVSFGSVNDPVSVMLGYESAKIGFLDALAMAIPAIFVFTSFALDNSFTFARTFFCFAIMEVLKGLVDWITVIPDSSGWQVCQERLATSKAGYTVEWYAQEHSFWDLFVSQLNAPTGRFCSDMMLSGHTQAVTVFGLGLFESVTLVVNYAMPNKKKRILLQTLVAAVVIGQQALEIFFVLKSRFHYTADIVMALVVSYLLYTSVGMAWLANLWMLQGKEHGEVVKHTRSVQHMLEELTLALGDDWMFGYGKQLKKDIEEGKKDFGNSWLWMMNPRPIQLGCCCTPRAQMYVINEDDLDGIFHTVEELFSDPDVKKALEKNKEHLRKFQMHTNIKNLLRMNLGLPSCKDEENPVAAREQAPPLQQRLLLKR